LGKKKKKKFPARKEGTPLGNKKLGLGLVAFGKKKKKKKVEVMGRGGRTWDSAQRN